MKKRLLLLTIFAALLCACQPAVKATPTAVATAQATNTSAPTLTASNTPAPATSTPTVQPTIPSFAPVTEKIPPHRLALNPFNAGTGMKLLNTYGTGALQAIAFSPNGMYFAAATGRGVYIYERLEAEPTRFIDVNNAVEAIAFSPDGLVLAAAVNGKVSLWSTLSGQKIRELDGETILIDKLIYGKGGHIAASGTDCRGCGDYVKIMLLWDVETGRQIYVEKDINYSTEAIAFTSDGKNLAFGAKDGLKIIDSESTKQIYPKESDSLSGAMYRPFDIVFGKDDLRLFITSTEIPEPDQNQIFDIATEKIQPFSLCDFAVLLTRTNDMGACQNSEKIVFFNLSNGEQISIINLPVLAVGYPIFAINPIGNFFAYSSRNYRNDGSQNILRLFDIKTSVERLKFSFDGFRDIQTYIAPFNGKARYLGAFQNKDGQFDLLDLETNKNLTTFKLANLGIHAFAFRPDSKTIATTDENNTLTLWDLQSQEKTYQKTLSTTASEGLKFSPDGLDVFFMNINNENHLFSFNLPTQKTLDLGQYQFLNTEPRFAFNQDGHLVMFHYQDNSLTFTDTKTNTSITIPHKIVDDSDYLEAFAISPNGKYLAFGNTNAIFVWDLESMKQIATLSGHEIRGGDGWAGKIRSLMFSPQSDLLVSVGWDETTRLWNIHGGGQLRRLNVCCSAEFTPDGRYLVTAGDGVMRVWGIPTP